MLNVQEYNNYLWIFVISTLVVGLILLLFVNLLLWVVDKTSHEKQKKSVWIWTNIILIIAIIAFAVTPAVLDASQTSVGTIENVVQIETDIVIGKTSGCLYVYTQGGERFEFYGSVVSEKEIDKVEYPVTVVYSKRNKNIIDIIPE